MAPEPLPPLRSVGTCSKCGLDTTMAGITWCGPGKTQDDPEIAGLVCRLGTEHMHRTCADCEYTWLEACLGA
jgi:hypothetical protein